MVKGSFDSRSLKGLKREYEAVRNASLAFFESLDSAAWLKTGLANDVRVSVRAIGYIIPGLLAIWMDRQGLVVTGSSAITASVLTRLSGLLIMGG